MEALRRRLFLCALFLFALNAAIIRPLFRVEYLRYFFSIEGTFIALARPHDGSWWPYWGTGLPFTYTYLPAVPSTVALLSRWLGWSPALAYHALTAFLYCLGPVTVLLLGWKLCSKLSASLVAGLAYSLISPSIFLIPLVRLDAGGFTNPQRLRALVYYGGGPQVITLTLVPLAIFLIYEALDNHRLWVQVLAGAASAAVALTDAFGAAFLFLAVVCLLISMRRGLWRALAIGLAAYLSVCYWLPPSLLRTAASNSQIAGGDYHWSARSLLALTIVVVVFAAAWWISRRWAPHLRFVLLLATLLATIAFLASYDYNVVPQGLRYHVEMEIPICLLLAFGAERLWRILPRPAALALIACGLLLAVYQAGHYWNFARQLILPPAEVTESVEYRITKKMEKYFGNERVMIAGSPALWANVFGNIHQLAGAHDQFNANPRLLAAGFIQYGGRDVKLSGPDYIMRLEAFGVHGINVPGPTSEEPYKPFHTNPNLFEGLLPVVDRDRGDTIYRVPQRGDGLAHVIPADAMGDITRYVAALNNPALPLASWQETSGSSATIRAEVQSGQVISVQTTYSSGWHATANSQPQRIFRDGLGMLVIEPTCRGACEIQLRFDGGMEAKTTWWISLLTVTAIAWFVVRATLKVPRAWTPS